MGQKGPLRNVHKFLGKIPAPGTYEAKNVSDKKALSFGLVFLIINSQNLLKYPWNYKEPRHRSIQSLITKNREEQLLS
jgi:hypothetical protein